MEVYATEGNSSESISADHTKSSRHDADEIAYLAANEDTLVWVESIDRFDYVRERIALRGRRRGPQTTDLGGIRVVGYTELRADAPSCPGLSRWFLRRYFTLKPHDRDSDPDGGYKDNSPVEAIDPRTVAVGVMGVVTPRVRRAAPGEGAE